jgi:hypothetical protein
MKRFFIFATAILAAVTLCRPAQAMVIIPATNVVFNGLVDGTPNPAYQLDITYDVTFSSGLYEYDYNIATVPTENIYSFALGGPVDPINTTGLNIINYGGAVVGASGFNSQSVVWNWSFLSPATNTTVSFTSPLGPVMATFTANDDDIAWTSPPPIPAPGPVAPVPEPSTFALLTALAFVYGLFRYRRALKKQAAQKPAPAKVTSH